MSRILPRFYLTGMTDGKFQFSYTNCADQTKLHALEAAALDDWINREIRIAYSNGQLDARNEVRRSLGLEPLFR